MRGFLFIKELIATRNACMSPLAVALKEVALRRQGLPWNIKWKEIWDRDIMRNAILNGLGIYPLLPHF